MNSSKSNLFNAGLVLLNLAFLLPLRAADTDLSSQLQTVEQTSLTAAAAVPKVGLFYSAKLANEGRVYAPIYPSNMGLSAWDLGNGAWLVDDLETPAPNGMKALDDSGPPVPPGAGTNTGGIYTNTLTPVPLNTNGLYLSISNPTGGAVNLTLFNATNQTYGIYAAAALTTPFSEWTPVAELWPTNGTTNALPFAVAATMGTNEFYRAMDWTGYEVNGLPASWVFNWFGNLSETASAWDPAHNETVGDAFTNGVDPDVIEFTLAVTNNYVNTLDVPVQLNVSAGVPGYLAVVLDDTNSSWQPYTSSSLNVNLGLNEGWHSVWIGLKGPATNATVTWQWRRLKLDWTPPTLVITNPVVNTVDEPVIQLQGYSLEALASISYDLSNALGVVSNQPVQAVAEVYSTNTWEFTTDVFQAFDVPLTNGLNQITVHAMDLAGNMTTTNLNFTLDYSGKTNPPMVQVGWPLSGQKVCGTNFLCQGRVSDPTATVRAQLVDTNNVTNTFSALVGRDGHFWLENLPLSGGTNQLTLTAVDVVSNSVTTNLTILTGDSGLNVDAVSAGQTQVTGEINASDYTVWVNGNQATNNGNGTWTATITPISGVGGAVEAMAIPNTDNNGNGSGAADAAGNPTSPQGQSAQTAVNAPQGVYVDSDSSQESQDYLGNNHDDDVFSWADGAGGSMTAHYWDVAHNNGTWPEGITWAASVWPQALPAGDLWAILDNEYPQTNQNWLPPTVNSGGAYTAVSAADPVTGSKFSETEQTALKFAAGGPLGSTAQRLYQFSGSVLVKTNPAPPNPDQVPWSTLTGYAAASNGLVSLGELGKLNADGFAYALVTDNSRVTVTPSVTGSDDYTFPNPAWNTVTLQALNVVSNSAAAVGGTNNWACVKTTNDWVYVRATLSTDDPLAGKYIQWSGGEALPDGDPFERRVTKATSAKTKVTAAIGDTSSNLTVWVVWANVNIQTSGNNPSPLSFPSSPDYLAGNQLGVQYGANNNSAAGKVCIIATATPTGVHSIIPNGWGISQNLMAHEFADGNKVTQWYFDAWQSDFTSSYTFETNSLDSNDKIYALDGPNIDDFSGATTSYEKYNNFYDWVTWNGQTCSDTNNFWHFEGIWKSSQTPQVNPVDVDTGLINLPANP